jgi:hypothetical protein
VTGEKRQLMKRRKTREVDKIRYTYTLSVSWKDLTIN